MLLWLLHHNTEQTADTNNVLFNVNRANLWQEAQFPGLTSFDVSTKTKASAEYEVKNKRVLRMELARNGWLTFAEWDSQRNFNR